jgi:phosphate transport system protein
MTEQRTAFHHQLQNLDAMVVELFAFMVEDLGIATEALLNNDPDGLRLVSERDIVIDRLYHEIEGLVNNLLVLQAPVAADFRLVISVLRVAPEIERSHDLVVHIAEHATHTLGDELSPRGRALVQRMGETAAEMWNQVAYAWYRHDREAADALAERDDDMDSLHSALMAELASGRMSLPVAMDMTLVARYYERLADHSVNIARRAAYVAGPKPMD